MKPPILFFSLALVTGLSATGCTVSSTPPAGAQVASAEGPPPPPPAEIEVIPPAPSAEFVWVAGFHRWNGRRYVWIGGHYDRRPGRDAHYVRGHWEHRGRSTVWVDGHWA